MFSHRDLMIKKNAATAITHTASPLVSYPFVSEKNAYLQGVNNNFLSTFFQLVHRVFA